MGQIPLAKFGTWDANGDPLSGGKVYTYEAGTSTPKTTYSDPDLSTANANPVVLDSRGEADIYGSGLYKIVLKTSADVTIWTVDNFQPTSVTSIADTDDDTKIQTEESADEDIIRFDINGTEQVTLQDGKLEPTTDNDVDLGSATKQFKDLYIDSTGYIDKIAAERVHFEEIAAGPTTAANTGAIYVKEVDGQTEIFYREESDGDEVQLTDQGRPPLPRGYINGLKISNGTDSDHDIDIAVGAARDSGDGVNLRLTSAMTKQIDAVWAAGTAAGGLFSGTVANTTWYYIFLIRKDSDGSIDAGFDTSQTAANIPTGYTEYRRIGAVRTDGSANILAFYQSSDRKINWAGVQILTSGTATTATAIDITAVVPPTAEEICVYGYSAPSAAIATRTAYLYPDSGGNIEVARAVTLTHTNYVSYPNVQIQFVLDNTSNIYYKVSAASNPFNLWAAGYKDDI